MSVYKCDEAPGAVLGEKIMKKSLQKIWQLCKKSLLLHSLNGTNDNAYSNEGLRYAK